MLIIICFFWPIFLPVLLDMIDFHAEETPTPTNSIFSKFPWQKSVKTRLDMSKNKNGRNSSLNFKENF